MKLRLGATIALFAFSCVIADHVPSAAGVDGQPLAAAVIPSVDGGRSAFGLLDGPPPTTQTTRESTAQSAAVTELAEQSRDFSRDQPPISTVGTAAYNPAPPPVDTPPPIVVDTVVVPTAAELVDQIFGWPGRQLVQCESGWNRFAVGPAGERGLLQIHPVHARPGEVIERMGYTWDQMFEVVPNLRVAAQIRKESGLRAWSCWTG